MRAETLRRVVDRPTRKQAPRARAIDSLGVSAVITEREVGPPATVSALHARAAVREDRRDGEYCSPGFHGHLFYDPFDEVLCKCRVVIREEDDVVWIRIHPGKPRNALLEPPAPRDVPSARTIVLSSVAPETSSAVPSVDPSSTRMRCISRSVWLLQALAESGSDLPPIVDREDDEDFWAPHLPAHYLGIFEADGLLLVSHDKEGLGPVEGSPS